MFSVDSAPRYVAEAVAGAARLQEQTTPEQYSALVERAEFVIDEMFTVETNVNVELQVKIALREKFDAPRVKQAILMVATWQLINDLAGAWSLRKKAAVPARTAALVAAK